jgi:hypothetical protein
MSCDRIVDWMSVANLPVLYPCPHQFKLRQRRSLIRSVIRPQPKCNGERSIALRRPHQRSASQAARRRGDAGILRGRADRHAGGKPAPIADAAASIVIVHN